MKEPKSNKLPNADFTGVPHHTLFTPPLCVLEFRWEWAKINRTEQKHRDRLRYTYGNFIKIKNGTKNQQGRQGLLWCWHMM